MKKLMLILLLAVTAASAADRLNGAGASFPAPLYFDWAYDYQKATGTQVNYQSIGSGGGIKQIKGRMVDFGASDKPLKPIELSRMRLFQFPTVIGSILVVYHLDGVKDGELKLKNSVVADIFGGKITHWDDAQIAATNPDVKLPHEKITVIHRADGSGTTFNFTYFLDKVSDDWHSDFGVGKSIQWATGIGGKGNEGISSLLKQTPNSIGYVEYAYKMKNNFTAAQLQSADGYWVEATEENVKAAARHAVWMPEENFFQILALKPGKNSYPITAATFIMMPREAMQYNAKVEAFFDWAFEYGDASAVRLGYIPLPEQTKQLIKNFWKHTERMRLTGEFRD